MYPIGHSLAMRFTTLWACPRGAAATKAAGISSAINSLCIMLFTRRPNTLL